VSAVKLSSAVVATAIAIPTIFLFYVLCGIIIRDFWLWFMVPLGLTGIGIAHAVGLNLLVKSKWGHVKIDSHDSWFMVKDLASILSVWLTGYIAMKFMVGAWIL